MTFREQQLFAKSRKVLLVAKSGRFATNNFSTFRLLAKSSFSTFRLFARRSFSTFRLFTKSRQVTFRIFAKSQSSPRPSLRRLMCPLFVTSTVRTLPSVITTKCCVPPWFATPKYVAVTVLSHCLRSAGVIICAITLSPNKGSRPRSRLFAANSK